MNKKLIALTLAALPVAAMADVTIYGSIRGAVENNKTYATVPGVATSVTEVNDWTSKIGFKGNEDLGNGLKTIWQVESRLHVDGTNGGAAGSADTFGTRDTFIGLSGNFGTVRLGKLSNYANSDMEQVDPGYYSGHSVAGLAYFTRLDGRINNAIRYDSPTFAGFSGTVTWGADEARAVVAGSRTNNQTLNVGLSYENAGFFGKYNYEGWGNASQVASTKNWHRVEGGYNANNIYVALGYQQINTYNLAADYYNGTVLTPAVITAAAGAKTKLREAAITGGYTFGKLTPYVSFVKGYNANVAGTTASNTGYKQYVLSANYDLSKRTSAYAALGRVNWDNSALQSERSFGIGMIHNF